MTSSLHLERTRVQILAAPLIFVPSVSFAVRRRIEIDLVIQGFLDKNFALEGLLAGWHTALCLLRENPTDTRQVMVYQQPQGSNRLPTDCKCGHCIAALRFMCSGVLVELKGTYVQSSELLYNKSS